VHIILHGIDLANNAVEVRGDYVQKVLQSRVDFLNFFVNRQNTLLELMA
jgi:hypothetical protein